VFLYLFEDNFGLSVSVDLLTSAMFIGDAVFADEFASISSASDASVAVVGICGGTAMVYVASTIGDMSRGFVYVA
jgi:hypothetical protein